MKLIEQLCDYISEEICDAEKYAKCANAHKDDYPNLARTFMSLSEGELEHMRRLHAEVENIIGEYKRANGEPPAAMLAVYEYLHKKQIDRVAEVKVLHDMFRE